MVIFWSIFAKNPIQYVLRVKRRREGGGRANTSVCWQLVITVRNGAWPCWNGPQNCPSQGQKMRVCIYQFRSLPWSQLVPRDVNLPGLQFTVESKHKKRMQGFQVWLGSSLTAMEEQISLSHFSHLALSFFISTSVYISRYNPVAFIKPIVICIKEQAGNSPL